MHEMSLCEGIRTIIEDQARKHKVTKIKTVRVEIGRFAGVEKKALDFAFDVVMKGSVAQNAKLEVIEIAGQAMCYDCVEVVEIQDRLDPCPNCGGGKLLPVGGDEMRVKDLEIA